MIIIVEGADLVGKTTVVQVLSQMMGIPSTSIWVDLTNPKPAVISVARTLKLVLQACNLNIIFDRSFLSECIYGLELGRETEYISELIKEWSDIADLYLVILTAPDDVIRKRYEARGDYYVDIDNILSINSLYKGMDKIVQPHLRCFFIESIEGDAKRTALSILKSIEYVGTDYVSI